jgi:hypothetical protein
MPGKAEGPAAAAGREARRRAQEALRCARFSELRTFTTRPPRSGAWYVSRRRRYGPARPW